MLRYLGLSLREIAAMLNAPEGHGAEPLTATLARQRSALRERRDGLNPVLRAVKHAQWRAQDAAEPEWLLYQTILKEIQMQTATDWTEKYYSPNAAEALRLRRAALTPEQQAEIHAGWQALFATFRLHSIAECRLGRTTKRLAG